MIKALFAQYRFYFEIGAVLALLIAFGAFVHHERKIGEQRVVRRVEQATAQQQVKDKKDVSDAKQSLAALQARLDSALAKPVPPELLPIIRVCHNQVRPTAPSPDAGASAQGDGKVRPPAGVEKGNGDTDESSDATPATEAVLNHAGALIEYLQGYIRVCQDRGFCVKENLP